MTDHLIAVCKSCGHTVRISLEHGGRRAKCPRCDGIIEIPTKGETSIRLRSDRELTSEARAKAGRTDDSDPDAPAARAGGRQTNTRFRRAPKKAATSAGRKVAMIATMIGTVAALAGIAIVMLKSPPGEAPAPAAPPPKAPPTAKPVPPTPPPVVDPNAAIKTEVIERIRKYVETFNSHNLTTIAEFYTIDVLALTKVFGPIGKDVSYAKYEVKAIDAGKDEVRVTLVVDRVLTDPESGATEKTEGVERVLTWTFKDKKWVITSPPQP